MSTATVERHTRKGPCLPGRGMAHRMRYEEPHGPFVTGVCRYCGATETLRVDPVDAGTWSDWRLPGSGDFNAA